MKFVAIALAVASAQEIYDDATNDIQVQWNQEAREHVKHEAMDLKETVKALKTRPVARRVGKAFKAWAHSEQVEHIKQLDAAFLKSPAGHRFVKEWKDFGRALKTHVHKVEHGFRVDNEQLPGIKKEAMDVGKQYKPLFNHNTFWGKKFYVAWKAALSNEEHAQLKEAMIAFKKSPEGHKFKHDLKSFLKAVKTGATVTDKPEEQFEDDELDLDEEEFESLLTIQMRPGAKPQIKAAKLRVKGVLMEIKESAVGKHWKHAFEEWAHSPQFQHFVAVDKAFVKSPQGQALMQKWKQLGMALKHSITKVPRGVHIDNDRLKMIAKMRAKPVVKAHVGLAKGEGVWGKRFKFAGAKVAESPTFAKMKAAQKRLANSDQGNDLKAALKNFGMTVKRNVKVTDKPHHEEEEEFY